MSFHVIIPAVNVEVLYTLLDNIFENTVLPSHITIINNSSKVIKIPNFSKIDFTLIEPPSPLKVNESWNLGISRLSQCRFVSVLNDDIEIPKTFFERIEDGFNRYSNVGAICPCTVGDKKEISTFLLVDMYAKMKKVEGWAFTIRKCLLDTIPPIPPDLKFFFGDDYFWWYTYRGGSGYLWFRDYGTVIYHAVGTALRKIGKAKRTIIKKEEREIWYSLKGRLIEEGIFSKT